MKLASKNSQVMVKIGGTPTALIAVRDWALNCERGTIDVSTISTEWKEFLAGQISASGSATLLYDPDNEDGDAAVEEAMMDGTKLTFYIRPQGTVEGAPEYQLDAFVTGWNMTAATDDAIQVAVSFTGAGPITKSALDIS
jgi:predicted secreted protein